MTTKVYNIPETPIVFAPTGGTEPITMTSLASGTGRVSDQYDRGAGAKPGLYTIQLKTACGATVVQGNQIQLFLLQTSVATDVPGNLGQADAGMSDYHKLKNLGAPVVMGVVDSATAEHPQVSNANIVEIYARYISVVIWNGSGVALSATAGLHAITLVPVPPEAQ